MGGAVDWLHGHIRCCNVCFKSNNILISIVRKFNETKVGLIWTFHIPCLEFRPHWYVGNGLLKMLIELIESIYLDFVFPFHTFHWLVKSSVQRQIHVDKEIRGLGLFFYISNWLFDCFALFSLLFDCKFANSTVPVSMYIYMSKYFSSRFKRKKMLFFAF